MNDELDGRGRRSRPTAESPLDTRDVPALRVVAVASAAVFVASWFPAPDSPGYGGATPAAVRAWAVANAGALHVSTTAMLVVAVGFVLVASALASVARRHLGTPQTADVLVACAAVGGLLVVMDAASSSVALLLPGLVGTNLAVVSDDVVVGWLSIAGYTHLLGDLQVAFVALALLSGTIIAGRVGLVNRALEIAGLVVATAAGVAAVGIVFGASALYPLWFVGTFGLYLALLVVSVASLRALRRLRRREASGRPLAEPGLAHEAEVSDV